MNLSILYFASLSDRLGPQETLTPERPLNTVAELKLLLGERGEQWLATLNDVNTRCAVNQALANDTTPLKSGDEVAFFPPVTGG